MDSAEKNTPTAKLKSTDSDPPMKRSKKPESKVPLPGQPNPTPTRTRAPETPDPDPWRLPTRVSEGEIPLGEETVMPWHLMFPDHDLHVATVSFEAGRDSSYPGATL